MRKFTTVRKLTDNKFLNLYEMDALTNKGNPFQYYFVSRNAEEKLKLKTKDNTAEGVVIYPILKEDPSKIVMIRQYRYPLDDYLYELPAGLIDVGENASQAAARELKEETGMELEVYEGGNESFRRSFYMGAGFTDESCQTVFGYASGVSSSNYLEESETIQILVVDKPEADRILKEENVSLRCAYLLMHFMRAEISNPFEFLR